LRIRYPSKRIIEVNKNKKKIHNDSKYAKSMYNDSRWWNVSGVELPDGLGRGRYCQEL
jgi:paraquat-inducible protein B